MKKNLLVNAQRALAVGLPSAGPVFRPPRVDCAAVIKRKIVYLTLIVVPNRNPPAFVAFPWNSFKYTGQL